MKDVIKGIKGLGEWLQAAGLDGLYDVSVRIGGYPPATLPRAGNIPRPMRRHPDGDGAREPVIDVFDEDDRVLVVVQLPGIDESGAHWSFRDARHLTIRGDAADRKYVKHLELTAAVDPQATSSFANGILELTLWKRR